MPRMLICLGCGGESSRGARGWRAYLGGEGAKLDPLDVFKRIVFEGARIDIVADVLLYCPTCAASKADNDREPSG